MSRFTVSVMLICVAGILGLTSNAALLGASEGRPAQVNIHLRDGTVHEGVYVIQEGHTSTIWSRDADGAARASHPADGVVRVEPVLARAERLWLRGEGAAASRNWENAATSYGETASQAFVTWYKVDALLKQAQALGRLRRHDEAAAVAQTLFTTYPDWRQVIDARELRAEQLALAGKVDQARSEYQALRQAASGYAPGIGQIAIAKSALGESALLRKADDVPGAMRILKAALDGMSPASAPDAYGQLAVAYGEDLLATGDRSAAQALFLGLRYAPVENQFRARAFLHLGRLAEAADQRYPALDAYITAAVLRGGDDTTRNDARRAARAILTAIEADDTVTPELRREYRGYAGNL